MHEENIGHNAGCTANVLVFDNENYWVANSGDSRSALCRGGKLVALSEDHKPESETEKSRIEKAGGMIMNGRVNGGLNLTRALGNITHNSGDFEYKSSKDLGYK
jgi:protein phosphatase 1G